MSHFFYVASSGCCRILHFVKENLCGELVRQPIGLYRSAFLRLYRSIQYPYFLHSIDHDLLLQDSDSIYLLLQRNYTPELCKTKIDISYLKFSKIPSYFLST